MKNFSKNTTILLVSATFMMASLQAFPAKNKAGKKPNVLLILADDLGYGDLSVMGGTDIQTPNIDQLFLDGLTFTNFYANSSVGSPTRASLLSGKYPGTAGVQGPVRENKSNSWGQFNCDTTLAAHFQTAGYITALIGKWGLGFGSPNLPNEKGFDLFVGFLGDKIENHNAGKTPMYFNSNAIEPPGHTTDLFSDWAADFIRREESGAKPFFLHVAYHAPQNSAQVPEGWLGKVQKRQPEMDLKRAKTVASIEYMDAGIGRIIDALGETNQLKNTIIIFSSDNGGLLADGASNGILRGGKHDLYEGGIRVPACLYWKDRIKKKSQCDQIAMTMDIYPTLSEMAGLTRVPQMDGKDLCNCIYKNETFAEERTLFWICRDGGDYKGEASFALRQGPYKMIRNSPFEDFRLYNLTTDPHEQIPLSKNSEYYRKMLHLLEQHMRENDLLLKKNNTVENF